MSDVKGYAERIVSIVSDETEIPCETILSRCSRAEVVDARWIAVCLLHRAGAYTMKIAEKMRITPRYVQYIITDFEDRIALNRAMRTKYEQTLKKLRNDSEITAL